MFGGDCRMRPERPKIEAEGRQRGWVEFLGGRKLRCLGERFELPQRGSERSFSTTISTQESLTL